MHQAAAAQYCGGLVPPGRAMVAQPVVCHRTMPRNAQPPPDATTHEHARHPQQPRGGRAPLRTRPADTGANVPAKDEAKPFMRTIKSFVKRAGRTTPGQAKAHQELRPTFSAALTKPSCRTCAACWALAGAPLVLEIGFGMGEATAHIAAACCPTPAFCAARCTSPAWAHCSSASATAGPRQHPHLRPRRGRGHRPHAAAGTAWTACTSSSRPLAQNQAPQAPPDPGAPGGQAGRSASRWAATCTAPPTGSPTPSRFWRCSTAEPLLHNRAADQPPGVVGLRAQARTTGPLTKFENRGIRLGHGVWGPGV